MKIILTTILLFSIIYLIRFSSGLIAKSENIILERPAKESKGLLEKPEADFYTADPEDASFGSSLGWMNRLWENAINGVSSGETGRVFFSSLRPWWKGPNVCQTNEDYTQNDGSSAGGNVPVFSSFLLTSCHDSGRAYKCTRRTRSNSTTVRVQSLTYECCLGFDRDPDAPSGCQKKVELRDALTTLRAMNATKLADALQEADLDSSSSLGQGNMTLFAPTDEAMANSNGQNDITVVVLESKDKMQFPRDILNSHLVGGSKYYSSDDFEDEMVLQTLSEGATIRINIFARPQPFATANCAKITSSDHQMTNGYVHVIDRVLTPVKRTLWQLIENDQRFSVFRSLIDDNMRRQLSDPQKHFTLLAFNDGAFEKLPNEMRERIQNKDECFKSLLLHHLLPHTICSAAVYNDRGYVRNSANRLINATRFEDGSLAFAGRKVSTTDQMATNGVMHVIDGVILFPEMLDVLNALEQEGGAAAHFANALKSNDDLARTLSSGAAESVTVFVPPAQSVPNMSRDDIRNHVVTSRSILARINLNRPTTVTTEAGRNLSIEFEYDFPSLFNWASNDRDRLRLHVGCVRAERIARSCNGAIVFLDRALNVPTGTVYDLLKSRRDLSEFVSMLDTAPEFAKQLQRAEFRGTVLAPTNQALSRFMSDEDKQQMTENPERLGQFLKHHVLVGTKCCYELSGGDWFAPVRYLTAAGTMVTATGFEGQGLSIGSGNAQVAECDLPATNGLVQVIDGVVVSTRRRWQFPSTFWSRFRDAFDNSY